MKRSVESTSLFTGRSVSIEGLALDDWQELNFEQLDSVALAFQAQASAFEKRAKHVKDTTNLEADIEHLEAILDTRTDQQLELETKTKQLERIIGDNDSLIRELDLKIPRLQEALETAQRVHRMSKLVRDGAMLYSFSIETSSSSTTGDLESALLQLQRATTIVQTYLKEETNLVDAEQELTSAQNEFESICAQARDARESYQHANEQYDELILQLQACTPKIAHLQSQLASKKEMLFAMKQLASAL